MKNASLRDAEFLDAARPAVYYVRALQKPTPTYNAGNLRCDWSAAGTCETIRPCDNGYAGADDDCLTEAAERAWSSPIYLTP